MRMAGGNRKEREKGKAEARPNAGVEARPCWCGATDFFPFGPEYGGCRACGTLVYLKDTPPELQQVRDDETDFYGKKYWLERQESAFGNPDIHARARSDLPERNLHWLGTLLKYQLPPAKVLDVGCAHGSFVALMRQAGYQAEGVELSPWVVAYGQETFGIPVHVGPVESLDAPAASLDAIVLMDVLEHLPDPSATMRRCLELLKPAGVLLIQTPCFKEDAGYETLVESKDRFLEMLIPGEHIYLFSPRSVTELFRRLGAEHIAFEPAIFAHYDMFLAVSRVPLETRTREEIDSALMAAPGRRMALALLDLRETARQQVESLTRWVQEAQAEVAPLRAFQAGAAQQMQALTERMEQARAEAAQLREGQAGAVQQIHTLTEWVHDARADASAARKSHEGQIEAGTAQLAEVNSLNLNALKQVETLTRWVHEAREQTSALESLLEEQRKASAAQLAEVNSVNLNALKQIETLTGWVHEARAEGSALHVAAAEERKAHAAQLTEINNLNLSALKQIETLTGWVHEARASNAVLTDEMGALKRAHADQVADLQRLNASAVEQIEQLTAWVHESRAANSTLSDELERQKRAHADQIVELDGWNTSAVQQIETLTSRLSEAQEATATLQGAMEEQKRAQASLLGRPMLRAALSLSNLPGRLKSWFKGKDGR
jgi:2-polyprenyl-3-methyl-5-hydroxy-6-metoxy-1,4-benzoquinol methylase